MTLEHLKTELIDTIRNQCIKMDMPILYLKDLGLNYNTGWFELEYRFKGCNVNYVAFAIRVDKNMNVKICKTTGLVEFNLAEIRDY